MTIPVLCNKSRAHAIVARQRTLRSQVCFRLPRSVPNHEEESDSDFSVFSIPPRNFTLCPNDWHFRLRQPLRVGKVCLSDPDLLLEVVDHVLAQPHFGGLLRDAHLIDLVLQA